MVYLKRRALNLTSPPPLFIVALILHLIVAIDAADQLTISIEDVTNAFQNTLKASS